MDLRSGFPYWLIKDGMPFEYPRLDRSLKSSVVIIGGGISGALAAYYLTEAGVDCILIDAQLIAMASTCASTGLLQYEIDVPLFKLQQQVGEEKSKRAYNVSGESLKKILSLCKKIGFTDVKARPSLFFADNVRKTDFIRNEFEARKNIGFAVEFLESRELKKLFGLDAPCGILSNDGAEIDAYLFSHTLLQNSLQKSLKVFARTEAKKIVHEKNGITVTTGDGYTIKTKYVVNATGYEAATLLPKKLVELRSTFACCSEQRDPADKFWETKALFWNTANPYFYARSGPYGRIIIGGRDVDFYDPKKRNSQLARKVNLLQKDFQKLFPGKSFVTEFCWAGTFVTTPDGLPYIGNFKHENNLFALGFGGNGITFSLLAAEILTDKITGKVNPNEDLFRFDR